MKLTIILSLLTLASFLTASTQSGELAQDALFKLYSDSTSLVQDATPMVAAFELSDPEAMYWEEFEANLIAMNYWNSVGKTTEL